MRVQLKSQRHQLLPTSLHPVQNFRPHPVCLLVAQALMRSEVIIPAVAAEQQRCPSGVRNEAENDVKLEFHGEQPRAPSIAEQCAVIYVHN